MNSRSIPFEKISNARDLGGMRTVQGHVIAPGHLLRSANLAGATEADRRLLQERYRLAKIIDLRTQAERDEKPDAVMRIRKIFLSRSLTWPQQASPMKGKTGRSSFSPSSRRWGSSTAKW